MLSVYFEVKIKLISYYLNFLFFFKKKGNLNSMKLVFILTFQNKHLTFFQKTKDEYLETRVEDYFFPSLGKPV